MIVGSPRALALALALSLALPGCGDDSSDSESNGNSSEPKSAQTQPSGAQGEKPSHPGESGTPAAKKQEPNAAPPLLQRPQETSLYKGRLEASFDQVDFGKVRGTDPVTKTIVLSNPTEELIRIIKVRNQCGCFSGMARDLEVPAGGEVNLTVTFNPFDRQGREQKYVAITTEEADSGELRIVGSWDAIPRIGVYPRSFAFNSVGRNQPVEKGREIRIERRDSEVQIKGVTVADERFAVIYKSSEEKSDENGDFLEDIYEMRFLGSDEFGQVLSHAVIETNDPKRPRINVTMIALVEGPIHFFPQRFTASMDQGESRTQTINLRPRDRKDRQTGFTLTAVRFVPNAPESEASPRAWEDLKPEVKSVPAIGETGTEFKIDLTLTGPENWTFQTGNSFDGHVEIETDHPDQLLFKIPFRGFVKIPAR